MIEWRRFRNTNYFVSNTGLVKSESKYVNCSLGRQRLLKERILKPIVKYYGLRKDHPRLLINLYYDTGKYKSVQISRMIAECFMDDFKEDLLVLHNDNDTYNNDVSNLRVGTYSDNNKQAWDDNRQPRKKIDL
jgi:hypothetical protein